MTSGKPKPVITTVHEAMAWRQKYLDAPTWEEKEYIYSLLQKWERGTNGEVGEFLKKLLAEYFPQHDASV